MRTTIEFDDDTAKVVEALRREPGRGVSEATNLLMWFDPVAPRTA